MVDVATWALRAISPMLKSGIAKLLGKNLLDLKSTATCSVPRPCNKSRGRDMTYRLPAIVLGSVMIAIPFAGTQLIGQHLIGHDLVARADAQQAASGPAQMQPELDNESMLVVRIRMAPHE